MLIFHHYYEHPNVTCCYQVGQDSNLNPERWKITLKMHPIRMFIAFWKKSNFWNLSPIESHPCTSTVSWPPRCCLVAAYFSPDHPAVTCSYLLSLDHPGVTCTYLLSLNHQCVSCNCILSPDNPGVACSSVFSLLTTQVSPAAAYSLSWPPRCCLQQYIFSPDHLGVTCSCLLTTKVSPATVYCLSWSPRCHLQLFTLSWQPRCHLRQCIVSPDHPRVTCSCVLSLLTTQVLPAAVYRLSWPPRCHLQQCIVSPDHPRHLHLCIISPNHPGVACCCVLSVLTTQVLPTAVYCLSWPPRCCLLLCIVSPDHPGVACCCVLSLNSHSFSLLQMTTQVLSAAVCSHTHTPNTPIFEKKQT